MKDMVLLGDEAFALGTLHAGLSAGFGYPGTPSTEIMEYLIDNYERNRAKDAQTPVAQWCSNEKTALEAALGVSFAGRRAVVTMKHVGLNVAADPFMNAALCGIKGGLIIAVADDPSMHSSQGEQDSRFYADFAMVPCFEPTTQQEAYEMAFEAFDVSEKYHVPVIMRFVTRLSHSRAVIHADESKIRAQNKLEKADRKEWMLLPALARKNYERMIAKQDELVAYTTASKRNPLVINAKRKDLAIVTGGLGRNYFLENLEDYKAYCEKKFPGQGIPSTLHIGTLPLPLDSLKKLAETAETILVIEEGQPFLEKQLRGVLPQKTKVVGKFTGLLPRAGELNPDLVRKALGLEPNKTVLTETAGIADACANLPGRPPQLCNGCPHMDSYTSLNNAVAALAEKAGKDNVTVNADIGCYALGGAAPLNAAESIVCMGASIGMARGASQAGVKYTFGVIGDSTFLHSGITNLVDCVATKTPVTVVLLDNTIVAMTGCQPTMLPSSQFEPLIKGLGVEPEHIRVLATNPANREANTKVLIEEAEYRGVSVVIMVRECLEAFRIRNKKAKK
ncbi:MAG: indolepyruvate ferredoxin oxidoreductase subunit alpha [Spirochaetaceae bacterium]|nr:indolepyruvate ferredoxin oxidoreductase subunit alpha [Spirochaetaceae bacterium]